VARSIDSDVDNVAGLLRLSGLLPEGLDVEPLLAEAKRQLHEEADYGAEARHLARFAELVRGDKHFRVPDLHRDLSTSRVLAMSFEAGEPLEALRSASQDTRSEVTRRLLDLALREMFDWGWMQTDPNLANFLWDVPTEQIVLLDFGATREVPPSLAELYRGLLRAALARDRAGAEAALEDFGLLDERTPPALREEALAIFDFAVGEMLGSKPLDFGRSDLLLRLRDRGTALALDRSGWRVPPAETLWVQRKLGGLYLLSARLEAVVDLRALLAPYAEPRPGTD
jgi:predicted unusual protein kinase regulating ubiquinone biosynthesis (AarF/ABC1/UbiB family)